VAGQMLPAMSFTRMNTRVSTSQLGWRIPISGVQEFT